jgi:hypothetical protein
MQSDNTFLSSIDYIDFSHHVVGIKSGYWKTFIGFLHWKWNLPKSDIGRICKLMKTFWIDRFSECSANKIKNFMLGKISSSFYNFKNILYYGFDFFSFGNPKKKNMKKLRLTRYYEKKAKRFYIRSLNLLKQQVVPITTEEEHIEEIHESDEESVPLIESSDNDYMSDNVVIYSEEEEETQSQVDFVNEVDIMYGQNQNINSEIPSEPSVTVTTLPLDFEVPINASESLPVSQVITTYNVSDDILSSIDNIPNSSSYYPGQTFE